MENPLRREIEELYPQAYELWESGEILNLPDRPQKHYRIVLDLYRAFNHMDSVAVSGLSGSHFDPNVLVSVGSGNYSGYDAGISLEEARSLVDASRKAANSGDLKTYLSCIEKMIMVKERLFYLTAI